MNIQNIYEKLRVFLVQEDIDQANIIRKSIETFCKDIKWSRSGKELLMFLEKDTCDFIIIDHHLGDILGLSIIEEMQKKGYLDIPTVILVEPGKEPVVVEAMKLGAFSFVVKTGSYWLYLPSLLRRGIEWSKKETGKGSNGNGKHYIIDKLTGIPTEHAFMVFLKNELKRSERYRRKYTLLVLDLKGLTKINLDFGVDVGNKVLTTVARSISDTVRGSDVVCRHTGSIEGFSGDEFFVLLETDRAGADFVVERLRSVINLASKSLNLPGEVSVDIGAVQIVGDMKDPLKAALDSFKNPS